MTDLVKVRTLAGRRAYADNECRVEIPHDRFVTVPLNAHVKRLLEVHGDIELEPEKKPAPPPVKVTAPPPPEQ